MGKRTLNHRVLRDHKSQTLPPSPSHSFSSSSSSDFEFTISVSPRKSSATFYRPADELFYKGQLLPLHQSPRLSMVRTLLLASSSTSSSSDATTTASRDSTGSSNDSHSSFNSELVLLAESCDSSRRSSSVAEDDEFKRLNGAKKNTRPRSHHHHYYSSNKYLSTLARFSSVFKKESKSSAQQHQGFDCDVGADAANVTASAPTSQSSSSSSVKRMSESARETIRKYFKKVKPLYEKLSQKPHQQQQQQQQQNPKKQKFGRLVTIPIATTTRGNKMSSFLSKAEKSSNADKANRDGSGSGGGGGIRAFSHSFSGNLRYPKRKNCASSCPSSIRSSPSHSGVLCRPGSSGNGGGGIMHCSIMTSSSNSSMDELQNAIQGAIAHCKNSLLAHNKSSTMVSNEL